MRKVFGTQWLLIGLAVPLLILLGVTTTWAQESRTLNVGDLYFSTQDGFSDHDIVYPYSWSFARTIYSGPDDNELDMLQFHGITVGLKREWTDPSGVTHPVQIAMANRQKFSDIEKVVVPVAGAFKRVYRNPYPQKILDGKDRTDVLGKADPVDANLPSDVMIYQHSKCWPDYGMGIDIERWDYAFANPDYDDFMIMEYVFTNTSNEVKHDVYFAFRAETSTHSYYEDADLWGNYYGVTYWKWAQGDPTGDSLRIWYSWDANDRGESAKDTKGRPDAIWGNFREPQYFSFFVIHADKSPSDESDDPHQPVKAGWSQRDLSPDLYISTHEAVYDFLSKPWDPQNPTSYSMICDENYNETSDGMYRVLRPNIDVRDFDMLTEQEKTALFSFGPYELNPGDDVRIVLGFAGGHIPLRWAIDVGRAYKNGYGSQLDVVPLPYDIYNPFTGELMLSKGVTLDATNPSDKDKKDAIIDLGKEYVFRNASKAIHVWKSGNVNKGSGQFSIPLAPATPSLIGTSENDQIRLQWGNEAEEDTRAGQIVGYRIYRAYKRPPSITSPTDTTFLLLAEVPASQHEYVDTEVVRGDDYYYYVTAVSASGAESSPFLNRTGTSAVPTDEALTATRAPDPNWQKDVVVVPNPYHTAGAEKYPGRRLAFLNLPAYANIKIYTMTGDLVQEIYHDSHTGVDDWERQDTFSTMQIVSGIYIYVVEELDGPRGNPTGKKAIGKFVVVK